MIAHVLCSGYMLKYAISPKYLPVKKLRSFFSDLKQLHWRNYAHQLSKHRHEFDTPRCNLLMNRRHLSRTTPAFRIINVV